MTPIQESFLEVLRAGLWETPLEKEYSEAELLQIWEIARQQSCRGLVAQAILSSDIEISQKFETTLQNFLYANVKTNNLLNHTVAVVVKYLRDNGIESVLLKGQGIGSYYKNPMLRECGDIDLYVGVENYKKACRLMDELCGEEAKKEAVEDRVHYEIYVGEVSVEIHRYTAILPGTKNKYYQQISEEGLSTGLTMKYFENIFVQTPEDTFNAFYIFTHFWRHFTSGGVGFRQICDWTMFLHAKNAEINTDILERIVNIFGLKAPWRAFGNISVDRLGLPTSDFANYKFYAEVVLNGVLAKIFWEGNFGQESKSLKSNESYYYFISKVKALYIHIIRFFKLVRLFPFMAVKQFWAIVYDGLYRVFLDIIKK